MYSAKNFAVLVDGENASPAQFGGILREVQKHGTIYVKRVYADWTNPARSSWKDVLHSNGARPVQQFDYGKDSADHALIMDAIEILIKAPEINAVCIASSDNGFQFVAQRIREMGKFVMGVGRRNPPAKEFIAACHTYVYFDVLPAAPSMQVVEEEIAEEGSEASPDKILQKAYLDCTDAYEPVYLGDLGKALKANNPAFDHRSYGFKTLKKMVKGHEDIFRIVGEADDRCFVEMDEPLEPAEKLMEGRLKRIIQHYGFIEGMDGADYFFYLSNIVPECRGIKFKPGDNLQFTVSKESDPTAEDPTERNGRASTVALASV